MKIKSEWFTDAVYILVGCSIYAAAVIGITQPNAISPGGFTGIAALLNHLWGLPIGMAVFILNIPLLVLLYKNFGGGFVIKTAAATFMTSFALGLFEALMPKYRLDGILAAVFGGVLMGFGLSLILLRGATTGGGEALAKLINKRFTHFPVGRVIIFIDLAVVALSAAVYGNIESALYSAITIYVSGRVIDAMLYGGERGKMVYIITAKPRRVATALYNAIKRGVTKVDVTGGYTGEKRAMLLCAVRNHEVGAVLRTVSRTDEEAFTVVAEVGEIIGQGFKKKI